MSRSTIAGIGNSVIAVIISHWISDPVLAGDMDWWAQDALVSEVAVLVLTNALVSPVLFLFPLWHMCVVVPSRWFTNIWTSRQSQAELDAKHLGPEFSIADRVADGIKTMFLSLVLAPILPLAPLCGSASLLLQHGLSRFFLLRLSRRPHWYDKRIMTSVSRLCSIALAPVPFISLLLLRTPHTMSVACLVFRWTVGNVGWWVECRCRDTKRRREAACSGSGSQQSAQSSVVARMFEFMCFCCCFVFFVSRRANLWT